MAQSKRRSTKAPSRATVDTASHSFQKPKPPLSPEESYAEARSYIEESLEQHQTTLSLTGLRLRALPPEIGQLTHLTSLLLIDTEIALLPREIGQLRSLRSLHLRNNRLASLPAEIGQLSSLTALYLEGNLLTTLPPEIGRLRSLATLNISDNRLMSLPTELTELCNLQTLYIHNNPDLGLPTELLGPTSGDVEYRGASRKSPQEILDAFFRIAGDRGVPLQECKLIVVGRGGAGKTSLIKRLNGQMYDAQERETHGITIQSIGFRCAHGEVKARVWDFGGQVVLHSMHEFFLTARSLYLLVLGERDDMLERDAAYWLQLIRSYAGDAPVVVALNKSAGRQRPFDRQSLIHQHGPIVAFVPTECSDTDGISSGVVELESALVSALDSEAMDSVRRKFPRKWHAIKADIEDMPDSYLSFSDYTKKCEQRGEYETAEQAALASDLHDLGIALNYGRDPRLRDTTVLRPDWLANGIYAVLRANDTDKSLPLEFNQPLTPDGVIDVGRLAQIHRKAEAWGMLRASDYPLDKHRFLLRLMESFHLSYPVDDGGERQLVPTLLPLEPPAGARDIEENAPIRIRYEFDVVPAPLLPWFIARTFSLIPDRMHWRRGALLVFGEARSRVWVTQDERYVFATVSGGVDDRRELEEMICGTFSELFDGYRGLRVTEQRWYEDAWVPLSIVARFMRDDEQESSGAEQ